MYLDLRIEYTFQGVLDGQYLGKIQCDDHKNLVYKLASGFFRSEF